MKLPFQNNLVIDDNKISNYLLDVLILQEKIKQSFLSHTNVLLNY